MSTVNFDGNNSRPSLAAAAAFIKFLDARVKLAILLIFILTINTASVKMVFLAGFYGALFFIAFAAGVAPARIAARVAAAASFAVIPAAAGYIGGGFNGAGIVGVLAKAGVCVTAATVFSAVTPFGEIIKALGGFGAPRGVRLVAVFLYRYSFVVADELKTKKLSLALRPRKRFLKTYSSALADVFARSYLRSVALGRAAALRSEDF
ncbi:MAG: CbiQ family ECF transporter T component [Endomicrobiia bacterium]|nr:CbiQ family ECF transporter T component [Endomicrobiia bacterium]